MANLEKILQKMSEQPTGVRYDQVRQVMTAIDKLKGQSNEH